jgi:hypothetical protein
MYPFAAPRVTDPALQSYHRRPRGLAENTKLERPLVLLVFKKFNLAKPLFRLGFGFIRPAEILTRFF